MPYNPNTCSSDTFVFDPPVPFSAPPKLDSFSFIASEKPPISSTTTTSSSDNTNHVLHHCSSPRLLGQCLPDVHTLSVSPSVHVGTPDDRQGSAQPSVDDLIRQDLLNFDSWLLETTSSSSSTTPFTTPLDDASSILVNGTATPTQKLQDGAGFDQLLSPLYNDASSTSAFNSPWTPYLDTPDPSPFQTPLFGYSNSEALMRLDQFLLPQVPAHSTTITNNNNDNHSTMAHMSAASTQDASTESSHFQADPTLLDFVLFDDMAAFVPAAATTTPVSIASTLPTPATASISPSSLPESTKELALQLVAAAAANLASSNTLLSPIDSASLGEMSLFDSPASPMVSTSIETCTRNKNNIHEMTLSSPLQMNSVSSSLSQQLDEFALTSLVLDHDLAAPMTSNAAASTATSLLPAIAPYPSATTVQVPLITKSASVSTVGSVAAFQSSLKRKSNEEHMASRPSPLSIAGAIHAFDNNNNNNNMAIPSPTNSADASPRPFVCQLCGRAFSRLFNLNTHKITHDRAKARQFACTEPGCKKAFTRKNDLQRHQISIHGVTHRFDCKDCKRPFARRDTLQRHLEQSETCDKKQLDQTL